MPNRYIDPHRKMDPLGLYTRPFMVTRQEVLAPTLSSTLTQHSNRTRICKRLWSRGIDSEESIPPAYVAWRAGTTNRVAAAGRYMYRPAAGWESIPGLL